MTITNPLCDSVVVVYTRVYAVYEVCVYKYGHTKYMYVCKCIVLLVYYYEVFKTLSAYMSVWCMCYLSLCFG